MKLHLKLFRVKPVIILLAMSFTTIFAQRDLTTHTRGKLWETILSWGMIGSDVAWDYGEVTGVGFYPGFPGYYFPNDELDANVPEKVTNANFHNFRSGPVIICKDAATLVAPDYTPKTQDYLIYHSSLAGDEGRGVIFGENSWEKTENFSGSTSFNPLLPEELNYVEYSTSTGIRVKVRSMAWSFPDYDDFIIYDYVFVNNGDLVIEELNKTMHYDQTLNEVWIIFHSGISVSTKGTLNFHYNPREFTASAAPAGGFGGYGHAGSDLYEVQNMEQDGKGLFYYSRDYNGGKSPVSWTKYEVKNNWQAILKLKPEWDPELQDPACFGFVYLYNDPRPPEDNQDPFEADPTHFSVYSDEFDSFQGKPLDFNENFGPQTFKTDFIYQFFTSDFLRVNDGTLYGWYSGSFGPYSLAPGDSVRLIIAEIAGQMDLLDVVKGDPDNHYPDSSIADINRNVKAVRNALKWGIGKRIDGMDLAADVPESPPAPTCAAATTSSGADTAIISVTWDKLAETTSITDGSGSVFYDGATDLSGYRIFRGIDGERRGAYELLLDIPISEAQNYWDEEAQLYRYEDKDLQFGSQFYYYVQAYWSNPGQWTSANGTVVNNLHELSNSDVNKTQIVNARSGPVDLAEGWDVFVAPNPYIEGDPTHSFAEPDPRKIEFRQLPEKATIKIFNISGELVRTIHHGPDEFNNKFGSIAWDQRSDEGLLVAPGLYVYVVQSETEGSAGSRATGKLMIIR